MVLANIWLLHEIVFWRFAAKQVFRGAQVVVNAGARMRRAHLPAELRVLLPVRPEQGRACPRRTQLQPEVEFRLQTPAPWIHRPQCHQLLGELDRDRDGW